MATMPKSFKNLLLCNLDHLIICVCGGGSVCVGGRYLTLGRDFLFFDNRKLFFFFSVVKKLLTRDVRGSDKPRYSAICDKLVTENRRDRKRKK